MKNAKKQGVRGVSNSLATSRLNFEKLGSRYQPVPGIIVEREFIGKVPCYRFSGKGNPGRLIIYLHGGCFALGSVHSHRAMVSHLCHHLGITILFIDYRLAPEYPFPAALDDILEVYHGVLEETPSGDISLMGDSAGGGLAISLISRLHMNGISLPGSLVMLSPWIDLRCSSPSMTENAEKDPVLTREGLLRYARLYQGGLALSAANPAENMSPVFPPTLVIAGSGEILLDDSKRICEIISREQPNTKLSIYEKKNHVWLLEDISCIHSKMAMEDIRDFLRRVSPGWFSVPSAFPGWTRRFSPGSFFIPSAFPGWTRRFPRRVSPGNYSVPSVFPGWTRRFPRRVSPGWFSLPSVFPGWTRRFSPPNIR